MRIPRLARRKPSFERRTSPPPAARKLLIASLASGLVLLVMLAIVFIPRGLPYESLPLLPRIEFTGIVAGTTRVVVASITVVRPLSDYNATYSQGGTILGSIHPLNGTQNPALVFQDVDADGRLTLGDEFRVTYRGNETLRLWYLPGNAIVGHWPPP